MKGRLASKRRIAAVRHFSGITFVRSFSGFVGRLKAGLADERVSIMLVVQGPTNTRGMYSCKGLRGRILLWWTDEEDNSHGKFFVGFVGCLW